MGVGVHRTLGQTKKREEEKRVEEESIVSWGVVPSQEDLVVVKDCELTAWALQEVWTVRVQMENLEYCVVHETDGVVRRDLRNLHL